MDDDATTFAGACRDVVALVTDYLEGCLDPQVRQQLEAHLAVCEGCRSYLAQMRATIAAVGLLRVEALPPGVQRGVVLAFRDLAAARRHRRPPPPSP